MPFYSRKSNDIFKAHSRMSNRAIRGSRGLAGISKGGNKSKNQCLRVRGRHYNRGYGDIPRHGMVIDEALDNLAINQTNTGFFYIIEVAPPNQPETDGSSPRYDTEESHHRSENGSSGSQRSLVASRKRFQHSRRLRKADRCLVIDGVPDLENVRMV
ncbi:HHL280Wp [Eremothecium sinecaudum]|uniref:HHL280Wp n=1 Tax=Eremothecium sinecaudum TaxID=45286 RepID=A0A0X8HW43_9SACH|nr:HHL280Wp [Eremothecium sinecaudum]AMD22490.1 HHL280Wp [Eremothecium sinecaudum]